MAASAADVSPHFRRPPQGPISNACHRALPSFLLAFRAYGLFARVLDALALVGFGLAERADFGGDVADLLLIDAGDDDLGRLGHRDRDALRDRINDIVAIAELHLQVLALQGGAITDTADLEPALETLGNPRHRIGEQRPVSPPHGARALGVGTRIDLDLAAFDLGRHIAVQRDGKRALGALYLDDLAFHAGGDAGGNGNRFFSDTRHGCWSVGVLLERSLGGHARAADCTATRAPSFHIKRRYREFLRPHCCRAHRDRPSPPWVSTESQPPIRCSHAGEP